MLIVGMIMIEKVVMNFMIIVMKKTMVMIMFKKIMVVMFTKSSPNFSLIGGCRVRQNWGFVAKSTCGCFFRLTMQTCISYKRIRQLYKVRARDY